jgi:DNA polymerase-3 subunit epsilon
LKSVTVLVGHNVRFDVSFLQAEYKRIGIEMPQYPCLDTMKLAGGGTLSACCSEHGIEFGGKAHAAIYDARATVELLSKLLEKESDLLDDCMSYKAQIWPRYPVPSSSLLPRERIGSSSVLNSSFIKRLAARLSANSFNEKSPEGERDYRGLLWQALEDGRIEEFEENALIDVAEHWGLSFDIIKKIHLDYLLQLSKAIWADCQITEAEKWEIQLSARLLGFKQLSDEQIYKLFQLSENPALAKMAPASNENMSGKSVCFTGEFGCSVGGQLMTREQSEQIAISKGLIVKSSVTKKLDMLIVADPNTQSGKAKKARQYGIRIIHEPIFWRLLGIKVD